MGILGQPRFLTCGRGNFQTDVNQNMRDFLLPWTLASLLIALVSYQKQSRVEYKKINSMSIEHGYIRLTLKRIFYRYVRTAVVLAPLAEHLATTDLYHMSLQLLTCTIYHCQAHVIRRRHRTFWST